MTNTVIMPQLGETVAEGKILKWFKTVGDEIKEGDNLFEVETDKVTLEVQSILRGGLHEIRVAEGVVAKVGDVVAVVRRGRRLAKRAESRPALDEKASRLAHPRSRRSRRPRIAPVQPKDRKASVSRRSRAG